MQRGINRVWIVGAITRDSWRKYEEQEDGSSVHFRTLRVQAGEHPVDVRIASAMLPALEYQDYTGHHVAIEGHLGVRGGIKVDRVLEFHKPCE
jgi:hypothetical protein